MSCSGAFWGFFPRWAGSHLVLVPLLVLPVPLVLPTNRRGAGGDGTRQYCESKHWLCFGTGPGGIQNHKTKWHLAGMDSVIPRWNRLLLSPFHRVHEIPMKTMRTIGFVYITTPMMRTSVGQFSGVIKLQPPSSFWVFWKFSKNLQQVLWKNQQRMDGWG